MIADPIGPKHTDFLLMILVFFNVANNCCKMFLKLDFNKKKTSNTSSFHKFSKLILNFSTFSRNFGNELEIRDNNIRFLSHFVRN